MASINLEKLSEWRKKNFKYNTDIADWFLFHLHTAKGMNEAKPMERSQLHRIVNDPNWYVLEKGDGNVELFVKRYTLLEREE